MRTHLWLCQIGIRYTSSENTTGFCRSSQLKFADFSFNFFVGSIPKCLDYLPRSSFQGNCLQHKDPKQRSTARCAEAPPATSHSGVNQNHWHGQDGIMNEEAPKPALASKPAWLLALEIVTGTMVGSLFIVGLLIALQRCKNKTSIIIPWKKSSSDKDHMTIYIDSEMLKDVLRFSRQELEVACEDFSNIIGSSPDSLVYKGTMKGRPEIAVISLCIKEEHWRGYLELYYQREVNLKSSTVAELEGIPLGVGEGSNVDQVIVNATVLRVALWIKSNTAGFYYSVQDVVSHIQQIRTPSKAKSPPQDALLKLETEQTFTELSQESFHLLSLTVRQPNNFYCLDLTMTQVPYITTALMDAKLGTKGRKDLFDWLSRQLKSPPNLLGKTRKPVTRARRPWFVITRVSRLGNLGMRAEGHALSTPAHPIKDWLLLVHDMRIINMISSYN
ncbi:hypothetical protein HYC85_004100 [Camellia sinensis]|uniref:Uncharacterized protein n=1 Tax=Camellia sinensis TaxID=4442 RepID=A0A7J7HWI5_CAMSI|nr:hypothetical protein HYC85_004100 [Camellia sinensis]